MGIPIGPDTSLLIAELLMQCCDSSLSDALPGLRGYRYIDDYELAFRERGVAEDAYAELESCVSYFELALNPSKTGIHELPLPLEDPTVSRLRQMWFRAGERYEETDIRAYFDFLFESRRTGGTDDAFKYGIARAAGINVREANWELFEGLLYLCITPEPSTLPYVLEAVIRRHNDGGDINRDEFSELLNCVVADHVRRGNTGEVAWALWGCLALRLRLTSEAVAALQLTEDPVVALMTLDCEHRGLLDVELDKTSWQNLMCEESLYSEHWMLAYEANVKGWLPNLANKDFVLKHPDFGVLKRFGVTFYDPKLASPEPNSSKAPMPKYAALRSETFRGY